MLSRWLRVFIGFLQCQYPPWFSKGLFWFWFATIAWRSLESRFFDVLFFVTSSERFCYYYIMWCLFGIPLKLLSNELGLRRVMVLDFVETPSSQSTHSETKLRRLIRHRSSLSSLLYIYYEFFVAFKFDHSTVIDLISEYFRGPFLESPDMFSHPESRRKISNFMGTKLFYSHILIITEVLFIQEVSGVYTSLVLDAE